MSVRTEIVAGSPADFMAVQHVAASGSQVEIGRVLAEQARRTYGWTPSPADSVKAPATGRSTSRACKAQPMCSASTSSPTRSTWTA